MPIAEFEMPDGRIAEFEVPDGTTPEQATAYAKQYFEKNKPIAPEAPEEEVSLAKKIGYPAAGAMVGAAAPIPGGTLAGLYLGEYAASGKPHGIGRMGDAALNTGIDLAGGKLFSMAGKSGVGQGIKKGLTELAQNVKTRLSPPKLSITELTKAADEATSHLVARGLKPPLASARDVTVIGRPQAEAIPGNVFPRNSLEDTMQMVELRSPVRGVRESAQAKQDEMLKVVQSKVDTTLGRALEPSEFGRHLETNLDAVETKLAGHDFDFWDNIRAPEWSSTGSTTKSLINKTQGAIQRANNASGGIFERTQWGRNQTSDAVAAIDGVRALRTALKEGTADQFDIDILRRNLGHTLRTSTLTGTERAALSGLKDGIENAQKSTLPKALRAKWDDQLRQWAQYAEARDFVKDLTGKEYEQMLGQLSKRTRSFESFWGIANDETKKTFMESVAHQTVMKGKSLASVQEQWRTLPKAVRDAMSDPSAKLASGLTPADAMIQMAAFRDIAKMAERQAASATANPIRISDVSGMVKWALTGAVARPLYNKMREIYPALVGYATTAKPGQEAAAHLAARMVEQFINTAGQVLARETFAEPLIDAVSPGVAEAQPPAPPEFKRIPGISAPKPQSRAASLVELGIR